MILHLLAHLNEPALRHGSGLGGLGVVGLGFGSHGSGAQLEPKWLRYSSIKVGFQHIKNCKFFDICYAIKGKMIIVPKIWYEKQCARRTVVSSATWCDDQLVLGAR